MRLIVSLALVLAGTIAALLTADRFPYPFRGVGASLAISWAFWIGTIMGVRK